MNKDIKVSIGYYYFKFNNALDAITFAETAYKTITEEDKEIKVKITFQDESIVDLGWRINDRFKKNQYSNFKTYNNS